MIVSKKAWAMSASSVLALAFAVTAHAQDTAATPEAPEAAQDAEVVVVTGIRNSQKRAVSIKRDAVQVVDAISSEDIGKFPDATISDALQRIPGVQVRREAGEAGAVNIRGLPQVSTFLNGEAFLGANSITNVQPNFGDIPSQLMMGAEVYKSATANQLGAGITGTVNLKTWRPFDLKRGLTLAGAVEGTYGDQTKEWEPSINGLVSWRNDRFGVLLSVAKSDITAANGYNGLNGDFGWAGKAGESWAFVKANYDPVTGRVNDGLAFSSGDQNGDGDTNDSFVAYQGWRAMDKKTRRDRTGINLAAEWRIADGVKLNAEYFHTEQTQWNSEVGLVAESKWSSWGWFKPLKTTDVGYQDLFTVQSALYNVQRIANFTEVGRIESDADNFSIALTYDRGGKFRYKLRALTADASQARTNAWINATLADQRQWGAGSGYYPGSTTPVATAPNGYSNLVPITVDNPGNGAAISFSGFDSARFANVNNYAIDGISSENNFDRTADMNVLRFDASYDVAENVSLDFGYRRSERSVDNLAYDYLSPLYKAQSTSGPQNPGGNGCLVKWKASDVVLNQAGACTAGDGTNFYTALAPTTLASLGDAVTEVNAFGGASGIPTGWGVSAEALMDPYGFVNGKFPGTVRWSNPGQSYGVDVKQEATYLQANIKGEAMWPFTANFGVQIVNTDLTIQQNIVGAGGQYGAAAADGGDVITNRSFTDVLPSANLAFDIRDDLKLRFGYAKNMTLLDLEQWGGAKALNYALDSAGNFIVISGSENGNPNLDPWRATNYDVSLEWYNAPGSMFSVGIFYVEVESFVASGSRQSLENDQTGGGSRVITLSTPVQGEGGILKGVEFNAKQAFTYLPGFWSNFGVDANYTYSPSTRPGKDLSGDERAFPDNSTHQTNVAVWYQDGPLQARVAHNYRSRRLVSENLLWGTPGLNLWQAPTSYVDASVSYEFMPGLTAYLQGSNLTEEKETYYMQWENQQSSQNLYERRVTFGLRARF
ncbi:MULTISPECIES: TonB-dependent receptor [Asticcacaulis]|uniref:TonB-dependent receptor n=1 Tax=Asticcacaulis TaxID=76890 RepID=UPI001AE31219|nr:MULTISPECIES: TonB-dependent receptor [Asticcacaulis]MBP2160511.1 TonB-dependent receptor [Asticcacaulis solisilvae]MDR6801556.1 TonB-dependent receptor [Asticcacaulis sp. BE141]